MQLIHLSNTLNQLQAKQLTVLDNDAFVDLTQRADNPSIEQLTEAAKKRECVVVPDNEYTKLVNPSSEQVTSMGSKLDWQLFHQQNIQP